jgi:hypothetical protein
MHEEDRLREHANWLLSQYGPPANTAPQDEDEDNRDREED